MRRRQMTFVVVGGGPTGVELAGAIGEMSRFTLARDFRNIDSKLSRIILVEAGPRILPMFPGGSGGTCHPRPREARCAGLDVEASSQALTIVALTSARNGSRQQPSSGRPGSKHPSLAESASWETDRHGRVIVQKDLTIPGHDNVFVAGDQACCVDASDRPLPGVAPVALQQGRYVGKSIIGDLKQQAAVRLSLHRQGTTGNDRAQPRHRGGRSLPVQGVFCVAGVARRPHLLPDGISEPAVRRDELGMVLPQLPPRCPADRRQGDEERRFGSSGANEGNELR